jgi:hypothetical protein
MASLAERGPEVINVDGALVERYDFSNAWVRATVDRAEGQRQWRLHAQTTYTGDAASSQDQVATALRDAAAAVLILNKPARSTRGDDALSLELRALIAERRWTFHAATAELGLPPNRVGALLCGQARWAVGDLLALAKGIGRDEEDEVDRLMGIARSAEG